eukprot:Clim_evm8s42 gene=Clim_evmTU8s42
MEYMPYEPMAGHDSGTNEDDSPNSLQTALIIACLAVVSTILLLVGYRLFKVSLFLLGGIAAFMITAKILFDHSDLKDEVNLGISAGVAFVLGVLVTVFWRYTIIVYGVVMGFLVAVVAISTPLYAYVHKDHFIYPIMVASILIFCALVMPTKPQKGALIIYTSVIGSLGIMSLVDSLADTGFDASLLGALARLLKTDHILGYPANLKAVGWHKDVDFWACIGMYAGFGGLAILGIIVQTLVTAKGYSHVPVKAKSDEEQPLLPPEPITPQQRPPNPRHEELRQKYGLQSRNN